MRKYVLTLLLVFLFSVSSAVTGGAMEELSIGGAVSAARRQDLQLKTLTFALGSLHQSRRDLYRSVLPTVTSGFSASDLVQAGGIDSRTYSLSLMLSQVVYNGLSYPAEVRSFRLSMREAQLGIREREEAVKIDTMKCYLSILLDEVSIENKRRECDLYARYIGLMNEELRMGLKTILEVLEVQKKKLETELELYELAADRDIKLNDLSVLIGLPRTDPPPRLCDDFDSLVSNLGSGKPGDAGKYIPSGTVIDERYGDRDELYADALKGSFEMEKLKLRLQQNEVKRKLLALHNLQNVSLSYEVDFTGSEFFPRNRTHTLGVSVLLDFGILSSDVSVSGSKDDRTLSRETGSESELFETLKVGGTPGDLRMEAYETSEQLNSLKRRLLKEIDVWIIKRETIHRTDAVMRKEAQMFERNEELFNIKLEIGEATMVDYMDFLIRYNSFLLEVEKLRYRFIIHLLELEDLLNTTILELSP